MTHKPMISVIIPFYNEYNYLENAVLSVLFQSYKNIEVLVVDDSGTHSARDIVKNLKDKRVRLLDYGENRGVSAARNYGLAHAKGDWVYFLDSDDFISSNFLDRCLAAAQYSKLPVAGIIRHINTPDKLIAKFGSDSLDFVIFSIEVNSGSNAAAMHHQYIYSKKFLDTNKIRFCEGLVFGEDLLFHLLVASYARFVCLTGGAFYYFRAPTPDKIRPYTAQDCQKWIITKQKFESEYSRILSLGNPRLNSQDAETLIKNMTDLSTPKQHVSRTVRVLACVIPVRKWRRKFRNHFAH